MMLNCWFPKGNIFKRDQRKPPSQYDTCTAGCWNLEGWILQGFYVHTKMPARAYANDFHTRAVISSARKHVCILCWWMLLEHPVPRFGNQITQWQTPLDACFLDISEEPEIDSDLGRPGIQLWVSCVKHAEKRHEWSKMTQDDPRWSKMIQASSLLGIKDPQHELQNVLGMHQYHQIIKYSTKGHLWTQKSIKCLHCNRSTAFTQRLVCSPAALRLRCCPCILTGSTN